MKPEVTLFVLAMTSSAGRSSPVAAALPNATTQEILTSRLPSEEAATTSCSHDADGCQRRLLLPKVMVDSTNHTLPSSVDLTAGPLMDTTFQDPALQGQFDVSASSYNSQPTPEYQNLRQPPSAEVHEDSPQPRSQGYGHGGYHNANHNSHYDKAPAPPFQAKFSFDFPVDKYKSYRVFKILSMNATLDNFKSLYKPILQFGFASGMEPIYHKKPHHHHHKGHHHHHQHGHHHHHSSGYNEPLKSNNFKVFHSHGPTFEYHQQNPDPIFYHQVSKPSYNIKPDSVYYHQVSNPANNLNYNNNENNNNNNENNNNNNENNNANTHQYSPPLLGQAGFGPPKPEDLKLNDHYRSIGLPVLQIPVPFFQNTGDQFGLHSTPNLSKYPTQQLGTEHNKVNSDLPKPQVTIYKPYVNSQELTDDENNDSFTFWDYFPKIDFSLGEKSKEPHDENSSPFSGLKSLTNFFSNFFKKKEDENVPESVIHLYPFPKIPKEEQRDHWPSLQPVQLEAPFNKYWLLPTEPPKMKNITNFVVRELPEVLKIPPTARHEYLKSFESLSQEKLPTVFKTSARDPLYHGANANGKLKSSHFIYDDLSTNSQNSVISQMTTSRPWVWKNLKSDDPSQTNISPRQGDLPSKNYTKETHVQDKLETSKEVKENAPGTESDLNEADWTAREQPSWSSGMEETPIQIISPPDLSAAHPSKNTTDEISGDMRLTNSSDITETQTDEFIQVVSPPDLSLRQFPQEIKDDSNSVIETVNVQEPKDEVLAGDADFAKVQGLIVETGPTLTEFIKDGQFTVSSGEAREEPPLRIESVLDSIIFPKKDTELKNDHLPTESSFVEDSDAR
ncbi:general transcriptional corepressor trfA-like [Macrobrachium nipponense]|uniref:general transcriptional corepressor trfA-like n=1 Tax=Macrobrachium nipponense TaxID=159736 RepID=UPI0030C7E3EE